MPDEITYIPLDKIKPRITLKVTNSYLKRRKEVDKNKSALVYDLLLAVEKTSTADEYLLVGGYDKYKYMLLSGRKDAPCIIETPSNNASEQNEKILLRLFNSGDASKENRQLLLHLLSKSSTSLEPIIKKMGLTKNEFKSNYTYSNDIPSEFISEHTSEKTLNWIARLSVSKQVKDFLYQKASLPIGDSSRLTHDTINLIKRFLKQELRFNDLTSLQQIEILKYALSFKNMSIYLLKARVNKYYQLPKESMTSKQGSNKPILSIKQIIDISHFPLSTDINKTPPTK